MQETPFTLQNLELLVISPILYSFLDLHPACTVQ